MSHHSDKPFDLTEEQRELLKQPLFAEERCPPHDFVNRGDGTAERADCHEGVDVSETGAAREPGPTGEYPAGKLTPEDEGGINFRIGTMNGRVVMDFGTQVAWIGMLPNEARQLAGLLVHHASQEIETWQQRLIREAAEVGDRIVRLKAFIDGAEFDALDDDDKNLLSEQLVYMNSYWHVLKRRVSGIL